MLPRFSQILFSQHRSAMRNQFQEFSEQLVSIDHQNLQLKYRGPRPQMYSDNQQLTDMAVRESNNFSLVSRTQQEIVDSSSESHEYCFPPEPFPIYTTLAYQYIISTVEGFTRPLTPEINRVESYIIKYKYPLWSEDVGLHYHTVDSKLGRNIFYVKIYDTKGVDSLAIGWHRVDSERKLLDYAMYNLVPIE